VTVSEWPRSTVTEMDDLRVLYIAITKKNSLLSPRRTHFSDRKQKRTPFSDCIITLIRPIPFVLRAFVYMRFQTGLSLTHGNKVRIIGSAMRCKKSCTTGDVQPRHSHHVSLSRSLARSLALSLSLSLSRCATKTLTSQAPYIS